LKLTLAKKWAIEQWATERGRKKGWVRRDGTPYCKRLATIAACDVTAEEAKRAYKKRANAAGAAKRKAQRAEKLSAETKPIQTTQTSHTTSFDSYAAAAAAQRARRHEQEESIVEAVGSHERTIAELTVSLGRHRTWRDYVGDKERFHQAIVNRLRSLGNRIASRYEARRQGGYLRLVRRR
jgi:hypothetical protein